MCKLREYRKASVELCRNCGGRGYVTERIYTEETGYPVMTGQGTCPCPVCNGAGRVWKVNAGTVQIVPFNGQKE